VKLGAFITKTRPEQRGDTFEQCYAMAKECFDTVTVIDGDKTWPHEFDWPLIGQHFQRGYEQCDADWVFHLDTDFIFHERDYEGIRQVCISDAPALSFWKYQIFKPNRYTLKSRLVIAVNKSRYGDRIRFDSGSDLCQPSLDGEYIKPDSIPEARIPFYNYEKLTKTKEQIMEDCGRMDRAYHRHFGTYQLGNGTDESAFEGWCGMIKGRYTKHNNFLDIADHPKVMQETIKNLKTEQFGYNCFGMLE
jgi:hypothetical protein